MPCALEINSNGGLKQGHVLSRPSTTENIISPLPKCLQPSNDNENEPENENRSYRYKMKRPGHKCPQYNDGYMY